MTAAPVVNLHAEPSLNTEVISQSIYGLELNCLDTRAEWIKVSADDGYAGWTLKSEFVSRGAVSTLTVRVPSLSANIYREPEIKTHAPLLHLPWEARLEALPYSQQPSDSWLKVRLLSGQTAFVLRGDVTYTHPADEPALTTEQMLALAHRFSASRTPGAACRPSASTAPAWYKRFTASAAS